jgi:hypothetical protein
VAAKTPYAGSLGDIFFWIEDLDYYYFVLTCEKYLKRVIQTDTHNSVEDSVAVMDLVRWRIANPTEIPITPKPFLDVLAIHKRKSIWIDAPLVLEKHKTGKGTKVQTVEAGIPCNSTFFFSILGGFFFWAKW